jgi:lysozyme
METKKINEGGISLIEQFEGFKPRKYLDPIGLPTIGFGTLIDTEQEQYLLTATLTKQQARELLRKDLLYYEKEVAKLVTSKVNSNQFSALVSFAYNLGRENLRRSTLLRLVNGNPNNNKLLRVSELKDNAVKKFLQEKGLSTVNIITYWILVWNRAGGRTLNGLLNRRWAESILYWQPVNN